jgi:hypothetical protein
MSNVAIELREEERTRCEVWTRVMGYHRPVAAWNPGKQSEHAERQYFMEPGGDQSAAQAQRRSA